MGTLVKSQSVLEATEWNDLGIVVFEHPDRNEAPENRSPYSARKIFITDTDWTDMGKPQEITVTIEPGDRLNK